MRYQQKLFLSFPLLIAAFYNAQKTNPAPSQPVTDEYFGMKITDEYRNLEDLENLSTKEWMKS